MATAIRSFLPLGQSRWPGLLISVNSEPMDLVKKIAPVLFALFTGCSTDAEGGKTEPETSTATGGLSEAEFKKLHELRGDKPPAPRGEMIGLAGGSKAYLSLPSNAKAPLPGIVVIHEWWGLNQHVKHWTDRLADAGYAALAVDLYGGKVADNRDDAMKYMRGVDRDAARDTCRAAEMFLRDEARIQARKTASIGWCFGGGWSLNMALDMPHLNAAVIYYGHLVDDPSKLKSIQASVLGIFGNKDRSINPEAVSRFEKAMKAAGKTVQIRSYDANHAFANPSSARYDQKAATDAWKHVREFLASNLR